MSNLHLPSAETARRSIMRCGDQFETAPLAPRPLEGVFYQHPERGSAAMAADDRVLAATGPVYTGHPDVAGALATRGATVRSLSAGLGLLLARLTAPRLVWGFSGYASTGMPCELEVRAVEAVYEFLSLPRYRPSLVVDGGGAASVLGMNGVAAQRAGIASLGFTPYQGLAHMAPRSYTILNKQTYREREMLVGVTPDVLVVVNGGGGRDLKSGGGAQREAVAAVKAGTAVLLLALRDDGPNSLANSWRYMPDLVRATRGNEPRMVVCEDLRQLRASLTKLGAGIHAAVQRREYRRALLRSLLSS